LETTTFLTSITQEWRETNLQVPDRLVTTTTTGGSEESTRNDAVFITTLIVHYQWDGGGTFQVRLVDSYLLLYEFVEVIVTGRSPFLLFLLSYKSNIGSLLSLLYFLLIDRYRRLSIFSFSLLFIFAISSQSRVI